MLVADAIQNFTNGGGKNRIYLSPNIPVKKLSNARAKFISSDEPILVLVDDTLFGSGKDGLAISEKYIYAKNPSGEPHWVCRRLINRSYAASFSVARLA